MIRICLLKTNVLGRAKAREHWKKVNCICDKGCKIGKK